MSLFLFWLVVYIIYSAIEEFQEDSRYRDEYYRTKELSELKALRKEVSELKQKERHLKIIRRTLDNGSVVYKEEYLEETETYEG